MTSAKLGQNFLTNTNVAEKIVRTFLPVTGPILEVGPGKGVLTDLLIKYRGKNDLKAVELDTVLFYKLKNRFAQFDRFDVVNRNILKVQLDILFPSEKGETGGVNLVSNVPYYISKEFIDWIIDRFTSLKWGVLMMQKEFVDKLGTAAGKKEANAQSVMFNYLFRFKKCFDVQPGSFTPQPKVKSTVFSFESLREPEPAPPVDEREFRLGAQPVEPVSGGNGSNKEESRFYHFLQSCFKNRRKTLLNNIERHHNSEKIWEVFESRQINPKIRAEQLLLEDFLAIYRGLHPGTTP